MPVCTRSAMIVRPEDFDFTAERRARAEWKRYGRLTVVMYHGTVRIVSGYTSDNTSAAWGATSLSVRHLRPETLAYQLYSGYPEA